MPVFKVAGGGIQPKKRIFLFEQPLAAIARALGADGAPPPAENQGFLRGNAS